MEVIKRVTEKGNKFYLVEVLYMKGNKSFYPYFSGYYASGMPIELKEGVDEDSPILTYQDIKVAYEEYEALALLMITEDNNDDNRKLAEEMVNEKIKAALVNEIEKFIKEEEEMEKMISENKNGFGWYGSMDEMNRRDGFLNKGNDKGDITKCKYYVKPSNVTFADIAGLEETKEEILEAIDLFKNSEKYKEMGVHKTLNNIMLSGASGCVDKDTEYFNGTKWVKISEYKEGDKVLVYDKDGNARLEEPLRYVKEPCDTMTLVTNLRGSINQCLSNDHRMIYFTRKSDEPHEIRCDEFLDNPSKDKANKYIKTSFNYEGKGIDLTDEELRVMVMTIADSYLTVNDTNYATLRFKKERKYLRAKELLNNANIEFKERFEDKTQYYVIHYYSPRKDKVFTSYYYDCNKHQMEVILDELIYWDGTTQGNRKSISTNVKETADFIQFIACSLGKYSTINTTDRTGEVKETNGKEYIRKSIDYRVCISEQDTKIVLTQKDKTPILTKYNTVDGFKYCFTVSTGMLVLRRNDRIFVTGNCGKTLLAKAVSNELDMPLFACSGDQADRYVGTTSRNIETLFNDAKKHAPAIIFIDEFESMAKTRTGESNNQEREGGVSTLLAQLDGLDTCEDIMVIVATNLPDAIDPAVQRRFPTKIHISNPDFLTRLQILKINAKDMKMDENCDLEKIARNLSGMTGGDIAQIMQRAGILAVRRGKEKVTQEELDDSFDRVVAGLKSKTKKLNENEKIVVSHHEIGHAIASYFLKNEVIQKISILPRTSNTLGYVLYANENENDKFLSTKEELFNDMTVSLAGRASEELMFGKVTGGCSNDLEKATKLAENIVCRLGMCDDTFGLMSINPNDVLMRERILHEVKRILNECYAKAKDLLIEHRELLEELAKILIEKEEMTLKDFEEVLHRVEK